VISVHRIDKAISTRGGSGSDRCAIGDNPQNLEYAYPFAIPRYNHFFLYLLYAPNENRNARVLKYAHKEKKSLMREA